MTENGFTVAVAESVTSGLIQNAFSQATDATKFFQGGITAYNLGQKSRHLNVEPIHAEDCNCVSNHVSETMAVEVAKNFSANIGIGITGYAAPVEEIGVTEEFAVVAIFKESKKLLTKKIEGLKKADPVAQQEKFTKETLKLLVEALEAKAKK